MLPPNLCCHANLRCHPTLTSARCLCDTEQGVTRGAWRTALLLILASWLGDCDASYTICSREPEVCNGTYSGTSLCAHTRCVPPLSTAALQHPRLQAVAG